VPVLHSVPPNNNTELRDIPTIIEQWGHALTVIDLAGLITLSPKQVYSLIKRGSLPSYRIASSVRLDPFKTAVWLRAQEG